MPSRETSTGALDKGWIGWNLVRYSPRLLRPPIETPGELQLHASPLVSNLDVLSPDGLDVPRDSANSYWPWPEKEGLTGYRTLKSELARRR